MQGSLEVEDEASEVAGKVKVVALGLIPEHIQSVFDTIAAVIQTVAYKASEVWAEAEREDSDYPTQVERDKVV